MNESEGSFTLLDNRGSLTLSLEKDRNANLCGGKSRITLTIENNSDWPIYDLDFSSTHTRQDVTFDNISINGGAPDQSNFNPNANGTHLMAFVSAIEGQNIPVFEDVDNNGMFGDLAPGGSVTIEMDMTIHDFYSKYSCGDWISSWFLKAQMKYRRNLCSLPCLTPFRYEFHLILFGTLEVVCQALFQ